MFWRLSRVTQSRCLFAKSHLCVPEFSMFPFSQFSIFHSFFCVSSSFVYFSFFMFPLCFLLSFCCLFSSHTVFPIFSVFLLFRIHSCFSFMIMDFPFLKLLACVAACAMDSEDDYSYEHADVCCCVPHVQF